MEILLIIIVVIAFISSASFRSDVGKAMDATNRALNDANDALEQSLREIEKSLPRSDDIDETESKKQPTISKAKSESKNHSTQELLRYSKETTQSNAPQQFRQQRDIYERVWIKKFFHSRDITKLIHFTDERNLDDILKYGLLSRDRLDKGGEWYYYNDDKRLDNHYTHISLSISNPNTFLLKAFMGKGSIKNPFILEINPELLWKEPRDFIFCQTNAAAKNCIQGRNKRALEAMFAQNVSYSVSYGTKHFNRDSRSKNEPTDEQAEILWEGCVKPQYIVKYYRYYG